ncbi:unnamed protein product [Paramecium pentaurelia]|uniref:Cyclin N-terminal domain-containing protein n=1 Tax=Paramecium pentaurelia TaxID=43138 RepID=A0A8S1WDQ3_9CILI|nr:unnamed protein product [Paramecium pentaurelia]
MSDTETESLNPYYKDILAYLHTQQILIFQQDDMLDEFKILSQFQFRLKLKISTLYLAKSIYLRTNILTQDYLLTSLQIATKFDQQERCKWQMSTKIETHILQKLNFEITKPTVMDFIEQLIYYIKKTKRISAEQVRLIYTLSLMALPWKLNYEPSQIAFAIIIISFTLKNIKNHDFQSDCYPDVCQQLLNKYDQNIIISQKYPSSFILIKKNLYRLY